MQAFGWKIALVATSLPATVAVAWWALYARDAPGEHPKISAAELAELANNPPVPAHGLISLARIRGMLANRDLLLLTVSYLLMNYVFYLLTFWCFLYLVQERHFEINEGGWLASLPFVGAALGSIIGGTSNAQLCSRYGARWAYRLGPLLALPLAGACLLLVAVVPNAYWAIVALCGAFALVEFTEAPYWAATMRVCPADSMAATGVLNTGGNLGGIVATPIVAALSADGRWALAFITGAGFALASAALWLWIDVTRGDAVER
jgi:sugar phosphate permease